MIKLQARIAESPHGLPFELVAIDKGSSIYHEGDSAQHWFEVLDGIARTCRFLSDGHRQLTGFFYPDDVFGVEGPIYRESAEAVTSMVVRRYPAESLKGLVSASGEGRGWVYRQALESARRSIFLFGHRTAANRLAAFLIVMAERSGASLGVQLPMTRSDIADHLNLTLHTVSRTISDFARKGLIHLDGPQNVRIVDLDGLRALAGEAESDDRHDHVLAPAGNGSAPCKAD